MKRIENITVDFKLAKKLKKAGFNYPTSMFYNKEGEPRNAEHDNFNDAERESAWHFCSAPTYEEVREWFRNEHEMEVEFTYNITAETNKQIGYGSSVITGITKVETMRWVGGAHVGNWYDTPKEANEIGFSDALEILNEKI